MQPVGFPEGKMEVMETPEKAFDLVEMLSDEGNRIVRRAEPGIMTDSSILVLYHHFCLLTADLQEDAQHQLPWRICIVSPCIGRDWLLMLPVDLVSK